MEQTFNDAIKKLNQEFCRRTFGNEILYCICLNSDYPWGDSCRLAEKMRLIGKLSNCILERGYIKFDDKGKEAGKYSFKGNTEELYESVAEYLTGIEKTYDTFDCLQFNCSDEDLQNLKNSVMTVFKFEDAIADAIRAYNSGCGFIDSTKLPSYIGFSSAFLHYHFPKCFFTFDLKTYHSGRFLFSDYNCELCSIPVRRGINVRLKDKYDAVYNLLKSAFTVESVPKHSRKSLYLYYCAMVYALGCYLNENCDIKGDILLTGFVPEVFKNTKNGFKVETSKLMSKMTELPTVSVDELYEQCKDVNDCNLLLGEYIKLRNYKERVADISRLILKHYSEVDKELSLKIAKMVLTYEKYAMSGGK